MQAWLVVAVLAASACGSDAGTSGDDDDQPDAGTDAPSDSGSEPGWQMLIERGWSLPAGAEAFKCIRLRIPNEMYISGFHVKSPPGTHHEILTVSSTSSPIGSYDCDGGNTDMQMLFAGGIQTDDVVFPTGVAIKIPAGTYLNLNLHVLNTTDGPLDCAPPTCSSGIEVKTVAASEVVHEADMMFLGTFDIQLPAQSTNVVMSGECSVPAKWTILDLWPHMHKYATHQRVTVRRGNNVVQSLLDMPYSYMDQKNYPMSVPLQINDTLRVDCTYTNPSPYPIVYGESATQEMCFAGFYKYPAGGDKYYCAPL